MEVAAEWVQFEIPYIIQVEDSFEGNGNARFESSIDGVPAELQFKKEARDDRDSSKLGMMFGQVEGDRLGNISYTKVKVGFNQQFLDTLPDKLQHDYEEVTEGHPTKWLKDLNDREGHIIRAAVDHVNQFLEVYRASLGYYWIRSINPSEVVYFMRATLFEDGTVYDHGSMYPGDSLTPGTATISDEGHKIINDRLRSDHQIPIVVSLRLDVKDKLDLGEYRLATITAGTMFEAFLKESLKELMEAEGWADSDIESEFEDSGGYKSISKLAKVTVPKMLHFKFKVTDEFEAWDEQTREKRNEVVHEGYMPSEDEARAAYDAANNAIEFLMDKIDKRHKELRD